MKQLMHRGFTLIELMVVVAVMAIVLTAVAPSFRAFIATQQLKSVAFDLTSDLLLARNEALKRGTSVRLGQTSSAWTNGWTVAVVSTSENVSTRNAPSSTVTFSGAPSSITFDVNGRVSSPTAAVRITVASSVPGVTSRCIQLDLSGRARSAMGACS